MLLLLTGITVMPWQSSQPACDLASTCGKEGMQVLVPAPDHAGDLLATGSNDQLR